MSPEPNNGREFYALFGFGQGSNPVIIISLQNNQLTVHIGQGNRIWPTICLTD